MHRTLALMQRLALALVIGAGFSVVWSFAAGFVDRFFYQLHYAEYVEVTLDGKVLIRGHHNGIKTMRDLSGNAVEPASEESNITRPIALTLESRTAAPAVKLGLGNDSFPFRILGPGRRSATNWYFVDEGTLRNAYFFVGYDTTTKLRVGSIGAAGFREGPVPATERFSMSGRPMLQDVHLLSRINRSGLKIGSGLNSNLPSDLAYSTACICLGDGTVRAVDLKSRTEHTALENISYLAAQLAEEFDIDIGATLTRLLVRTAAEVLVFDGQFQLVRKFPIPAEMIGDDITWYLTKGGSAVAMTSVVQPPPASGTVYRVAHIQPSGAIVHREEATINSQPARMLETILMGSAAPEPVLVYLLLVLEHTSKWLANKAATTRVQALGFALRELWPALLVAHLIGLIFAVVCIRRQNRYAVRGTELWVWPLFILLLGLPGWVGFLYCRRWPRLAACPACQVIVPRNQPVCPRCATAYPPPALRGTEVFA